MAYGTKDEDYIRSLTMRAEEQVQGITTVLVPGRFLVNSFPILRHVPTWLPGTGWKKFLQELAILAEEVTVTTFEDAKQRIVRAIYRFRSHAFIDDSFTWQKHGKQDELPSLVAQLVKRLPPSNDPDFEVQEAVARNVAAGAYIGRYTILSISILLLNARDTFAKSWCRYCT